MKVFGVTCGRKNGNSEILLKEAFMAIEEICGAECECEYVRLQDAEIRSCTGCETCMRNHLSGNWEFRCIHGKDADHLYTIEQHFRAADAIIISAPIYNLQPTGILLRLFNKLHGTGDYRRVVREGEVTYPKLGACIAVGGTDWTNFGTTYAAMATSEFVGKFENMVDQMCVQFAAAPGAVLIDDEAMQRAHQLGVNVANALLSGKRSGVYAGEEGACPYCHGSMLELRGGELWCPMCEMKADFTVEDGKLKVSFTEDALEHARWSKWGLALHDSRISAGHKRYAENIETINKRKEKYIHYKEPIELPHLTR